MSAQTDLEELLEESDENNPGVKEYMEVLEKAEEYSRLAEDYESKSNSSRSSVTFTNRSD